MLFHVIHTHTVEECPARSPEQTRAYSKWWQTLKKTSGVKVLAGYVSPLDHTFYITMEADDYPTLARVLGPLLSIGTGRVIPVLTLEQTFPIAEAGALRASK
jgi:hypothetical protein